MNPIRNLWRGKYPLWLTFWAFYVLGYAVSVGLTALITPNFHTQPWRWLSAMLLVVPYSVLSAVGVWRSADAYPLTRWWPNMAKICVMLWSARIAWSMSLGTMRALAEW